MNKIQISVLAGAAAFSLVSAALGGTGTLADGNSLVNFNTDDPTTRTGMTQWQVDGVDQLWNQWFWYRVGDTGGEHRFNSTNLTEQAFGTSDSDFNGTQDTFFIRYGGNGFTAQFRFALTGGSAGSGRSDMAEQIRITNTGSTPLSYHFFQYCDFDLAGTIPDTSVTITGNNTADQQDGAFHTTETVVTPQPSHHEVGTYPDTIGGLDDASPTTFNDTSSLSNPNGADYTWGFQWDFVLNPGDSYLISKDKSIVPGPGALSVLGLASLTIARRRRR